jgi:subtilisin family serine protease
MAEARWRVGLIDSGVAAGCAVLNARRFRDDTHGVRREAAVPDSSGHGTAVAAVLGGAAGLLVGQVLDAHGRATAAALADAIDWAREEGAQLLHLSLGLGHDRAVLASAVARALAAGIIVVAAAPARGVRTWPAAYPGVIRATGDARCAGGEISHRPSPEADFGGCAAMSFGARTRRGASIGAAHVTRFVLAHCAPGTPAAALRAEVAALASYCGAERVAAHGGR